MSVSASAAGASAPEVEIVEPQQGVARRLALLPPPPPPSGSHSSSKKAGGAAVGVLGVEEVGASSGGLALLLTDGSVRFLEVGDAALRRALRDWRLNFPGVGKEELARSVEEEEAAERRRREKGGASVPKTGTGAPKRGKEDAKNEPHVGGNTWAGGTGGSDTAGLGGRGGPYRLDKGHVVHQVGLL